MPAGSYLADGLGTAERSGALAVKITKKRPSSPILLEESRFIL